MSRRKGRGPSEKTLAALRILRDHPGIRPREFAKRMWPDSPKWRVHYKCGPSGSHTGGAMYLAGGAYLGRLVRMELAEHGGYLSVLGRFVLERAEGKDAQ